ncbi:MAG: RDD family protein [Phycisphaerae bacterium]|nr:RDD family protein [Phycisphaerae bacterium]MDW8263278.1 RDD family protein [Phycisphaerales bacterium]
MIPLRVSLICLLSLTATGQATARRDVLTCASENRYWVAQVLPPGGSQNYVRTAVRVRQANTPAWQLVSVLRGRVIDLAPHNNNLAVLMDDGTWLLAWPGGSSSGLRLPGPAALRALAGDQQAFWALGVSLPLTDDQARQGPAISMPVFRFERGSWKPHAPAPTEVRHDSPLSLAVFDGRPMLAWRESDRSIGFTRLDRADEWSPVERVETDFEITDFRLLGNAPTPMLWVAPADSAGELHLRRERWGPPIVLRGSTPTAGEHRSASYFAGNLRVVALKGGRLFEEAFSLEGSTVAGVQELGRTPPPPAPPISRWSVVLMVLCALMLTAAIFRREEEEPLRFGRQRWMLAPLPRRAAAGLIDAIPLIAVFAWFTPESQQGDSLTADQVMYPLLGAVAIYLTHTTLLELATARSLGKLICRLRVVTLEGDPPRKSALLIRHALRVVDVLPALPLALLILFSPLRQRLGDVLARTIVVLDAPASDETPS